MKYGGTKIWQLEKEKVRDIGNTVKKSKMQGKNSIEQKKPEAGNFLTYTKDTDP